MQAKAESELQKDECQAIIDAHNAAAALRVESVQHVPLQTIIEHVATLAQHSFTLPTVHMSAATRRFCLIVQADSADGKFRVAVTLINVTEVWAASQPRFACFLDCIVGREGEEWAAFSGDYQSSIFNDLFFRHLQGCGDETNEEQQHKLDLVKMAKLALDVFSKTDVEIPQHLQTLIEVMRAVCSGILALVDRTPGHLLADVDCVFDRGKNSRVLVHLGRIGKGIVSRVTKSEFFKKEVKIFREHIAAEMMYERAFFDVEKDLEDA